MDVFIDVDNIKAIKTELHEAIVRRLKFNSNQTPAQQYTVTIMAVSEIIADLTFSAAKDPEHALTLLAISNGYVKARWKELGDKHEGGDRISEQTSRVANVILAGPPKEA